MISNRWERPKIGRFSFLSQQKANQNQRYVFFRSPPIVIGGLDLQLKKAEFRDERPLSCLGEDAQGDNNPVSDHEH